MRLSLVSIGVELYAATANAEATALHQIHKPSGTRVRYEKVVPRVGPVQTSDIVKGFEIDDDSYVVLEPEELEEIKLESSRAIEPAQFVDRAEIASSPKSPMPNARRMAICATRVSSACAKTSRPAK